MSLCEVFIGLIVFNVKVHYFVSTINVYQIIFICRRCSNLYKYVVFYVNMMMECETQNISVI